mmetsp:Transcript_11707/g.28423  ORF Transcript_11707/g.28423 Transcript_11707/m.28423 type:complete len:207 (-) Transcript_11707:1525-2145(-)
MRRRVPLAVASRRRRFRSRQTTTSFCRRVSTSTACYARYAPGCAPKHQGCAVRAAIPSTNSRLDTVRRDESTGLPLAFHLDPPPAVARKRLVFPPLPPAPISTPAEVAGTTRPNRKSGCRPRSRRKFFPRLSPTRTRTAPHRRSAHSSPLPRSEKLSFSPQARAGSRSGAASPTWGTCMHVFLRSRSVWRPPRSVGRCGGTCGSTI